MVKVDEIRTAAAEDFKAAERLARLSLRGHAYSHLPNSTVNWSLEGNFICRVEECPKYGATFSDMANVKKHLNSQGHKVRSLAVSKSVI